MITIATDENFETLKNSGFTIVDFYSTTCTPCKMLARVFEDFALEYPFVNIVKINISHYPKVGKDYEVEAVPTIMVLQDGELLMRDCGSMEYEEVVDLLKKYYYGNGGEQ